MTQSTNFISLIAEKVEIEMAGWTFWKKKLMQKKPLYSILGLKAMFLSLKNLSFSQKKDALVEF